MPACPACATPNPAGSRRCTRCGAPLPQAAPDAGRLAGGAPGARSASPPPSASGSGTAPLVAGASLGRYRILGEIGRGGMAVVYRALDPALGREVAIKVILERGSPLRQLARFQREAQLVAALNHPNIVRVYDVGESDGRPYLVMELLDGRSLAGILREEVPWRILVGWVRDCAGAIGYAHRKGVLHRDLKPQNVMVDAAGQPKILDFGLSKAMGIEERLTQTGAVVGTPLYMAPEQLRGQLKDLDARADIYALGVILYEGLTGRFPYRAQNPVLLLQAIESGPPALPSSLVGGSEPPDRRSIEALDAVILRALSVDRRGRHATAEDLAQDLDAILGGLAPAAAHRRGGAKVLAAAGATVLLAAAAAAFAFPDLMTRWGARDEVGPSPAEPPGARLLAEIRAIPDAETRVVRLRAFLDLYPGDAAGVAALEDARREIARSRALADATTLRDPEERHARLEEFLAAHPGDPEGTAALDGIRAWTRIEAAAGVPRVQMHALAYDEARRAAVSFGGLTEGGSLSEETWILGGLSWMSRPGAPGDRMPPLYRHAMAYDSRRQVIVLFGGTDPGGRARDRTYEWDGASWSERPARSRPPARYWHAMAYDPGRGVTVLFGGMDGTRWFDDTWEWDGSDWSERRSDRAPAPRNCTAMAHDPARGVTVLFGGHERGQVYRDDTWEWDGTYWTPQDVASGPAARGGAVLVWDPVRRAVVLFSGNRDQQFYTDTWVFDGDRWVERHPIRTPPARIFSGAAYDADLRGVLIFGGWDGHGSYLGDTWIWPSPGS